MNIEEIVPGSVWQSNEDRSSLGGRIRRCSVVALERRKVVLRNLNPPHRVTRVDARFFGVSYVKGWRRVPGVMVLDGVLVVLVPE